MYQQTFLQVDDTMRSILTEVKLSLSVSYRLIITVVHSPSVLFTTISQPSKVTNCLTNASPSPNPSVHLAASPCQNGSRIRVNCSGEIPDQVSVICMP